ncbi:MAG TPA: hypothetical protein VEV17_20540 [Bryobacteraceae bacterium]|nr:hypothetical protein [Bryobacteraceae bacterium]
MNYEQAILSLQDTLVVMAEIQRRQSEVQPLQAAGLDAVRERARAQEKWSQAMEKWSNEFAQHMSELGDQLDGLIGYVEHLPKHPAPQ